MFPRLSQLACPSLLLRLVLVLAVWTGPVPYCHCHGTLNDASAQSFGWLGKHLQACHETDDLFADIDFGWHLHLPDPAEEDTDQPEWLSWSGGGSKTVSCISLNCLDGYGYSVWMLTPQPPAPSATAAVAKGRTFFGSFAPTLPLPLRFGVIRC